MADIAVSGASEVVYLSKNTPVSTPAGQVVATTDTAGVLTPATGNPFKGRYMLVRMVESGAGTDNTVTFEAGVTGQTPANLAVLGDLEVSVPAASDQVIQLELARFLQADGTVRAVVGGTTGSVTLSVIQLSKAC